MRFTSTNIHRMQVRQLIKHVIMCMKAWRQLIISDCAYNRMLGSFTYLIVWAQHFQLSLLIKESHQKNKAISNRNRFHFSKEMIKDDFTTIKSIFLCPEPHRVIWHLTFKCWSLHIPFCAFPTLMMDFFLLCNKIDFVSLKSNRTYVNHATI